MSTDTPPSRPSKRDELERMKRRQPFQGKERLRLVFMAAGLLGAIGLFLWLRNGLGGKPDPDKTTQEEEQFAIGSDIMYPPVAPDMFTEVKDRSTTDRLLLDSGSFTKLLKASRGLLPGHLDALGSPRLDFENIEQNAPNLRGSLSRERGKVLDLKTQQRTIDGPEETWALIETDGGHRYWFVCQIAPLELFGIGGNYVVTDGYFYKIFTGSIDGDRVTAPLLVGREMRPSVRKAEPAKEIDQVLLADVRDAEFGEERELEDEGYWHLLNFSAHLSEEPERLLAEFARARPLDRKVIEELSDQPELYRGQPFRIYGQTAHSFSRACEENPQRLRFASHSFLFKYELGDNYLRLAAPGRGVLEDVGLATEMLGYFHKFWAYVDGEGNQRRVPVFAIAGFTERELPRSPLEGQIVLAFIALFVVMLLGFTWLVRRDRRQAEQAAVALRARRSKIRARIDQDRQDSSAP